MFYGNDPRPGDNQEHPIKVEKDEYVVNRNAARKHRDLLDYINFVDEPRYDNKEMAHSSIDEAISLNTLSGMQEGGVAIRRGEPQEPNMEFVNIASLDYPDYNRYGQRTEPDFYQELGEKYENDFNSIRALMSGTYRDKAARDIFYGMGTGDERADENVEKYGATARDQTLARKYTKAFKDLSKSLDSKMLNLGQDYYAFQKGVKPRDELTYNPREYSKSLYDEKQLKEVREILSEMSDSKLYKDIESDYINVKYRDMPSKYKIDMSGYQDGGDVKAYIDSSDSSVVVANPKQSKMFDEIVNSVTFAPKTSKKYQLETIIDMLNNPDKYKEGVDADFPVTGESIGAVDSLSMYMNKFNQDRNFMGYDEEEAGILEKFGRPEFRRAGRTAQDEGFIMNKEEINKALNYLAERHQQGTLGMGASGMQSGGSTYGYGSQVSTSPTFEDLYSYAGIEPSPEQRAKFEGNFRYDPSREEGTIADYMRGVENLQQTGQGTLRGAGVKSRAAGAGFGGFGKREEMQDVAGSAARSKYSSGLGQAQQDRFESIRGQRESWMTDAMGELGRIEELGGTDVYEEPSEAPNFLTGQGDSNPEGWTGGTPTTGTNFTDTNGVSWNFVDIPGVGGMWQEQT